MKIPRVGMISAALGVNGRVEIGAAAEPAFRRDDHAGIHVYCGHARVFHVRNDADAGSPEAGIEAGAPHMLGKVRRKGAMDGRGMNADFLEQPPAHHAHQAAALIKAFGAVRTTPWLTLKRCAFAGI